MTNSSRNFLLALLALTSPALALAQNQTQPVKPVAAPPRPRPVVATPSPSQQWQRQVDRQQLQSQQDQSALRERLRQDNLDMQRSNTSNPALRNQLDAADRSQQDLYRARQNAAVRRYQTEQQTDDTRTLPARSASAGH